MLTLAGTYGARDRTIGVITKCDGIQKKDEGVASNTFSADSLDTNVAHAIDI